MPLKAVVQQTLRGADVINVLHFDGADAVLANKDQIGQAIADAYRINMQPQYSSEYEFTGVLFYDTAAPSGAPGQPAILTGVPWQGTNADDAAINQLAYVVGLTAAGGPPFRGRIFLGGFYRTATGSSGGWSGPPTTAATGLAQALLSIGPAIGGVVNWVIYRPAKTNPVVVEAWAQVTSFNTNTTPATLRRRKLGVGS